MIHDPQTTQNCISNSIPLRSQISAIQHGTFPTFAKLASEYKPSSMLFGQGYTVNSVRLGCDAPDVARQRNVLIFKGRNVGYRLPIDAASQTRRTEPSATPLRNHKTCKDLSNITHLLWTTDLHSQLSLVPRIIQESFVQEQAQTFKNLPKQC